VEEPDRPVDGLRRDTAAPELTLANHHTSTTKLSSVSRPGESGDFEPWEGWSHARRDAQAVSA
jgi:hypothetical protein